MGPLESITDWPVATAAAAWIAPDDAVTTFGDTDRPFALASITKLLTAMATLVAHEEGTLDLDEALTDDGATPADLLAHAGGTGPDARTPLSKPHRRRIYSTFGYEILADRIARRAEMPFSEYLTEALLTPLDMAPHQLTGSAGAAATASVNDLVRLAAAWRQPQLVDETTLARATKAHLPHLDGVLPGFGRQSPNLWCLGPEQRGTKHPHWTGPLNSPATYGHFGQSGTMMWIDPTAGHTLISLTDEPFGPWAIDAWPALSDTILQQG